MRSYLLLFLTVFVVSCSSTVAPIKKFSAKQKILESYIKKYQEMFTKAPDSLSKETVLNLMWSKHILFIQDTMKFSTFPEYTLDTFYFEKAHIEFKKEKDGTRIDVMFQNETYDANAGFVFSRKQPLELFPEYLMLKKLKDDLPVFAVIHVQDFGLNPGLLKQRTIRPILACTVKSILILNSLSLFSWHKKQLPPLVQKCRASNPALRFCAC